MKILGISCGFHDAAASLIDDSGNILFAGHAERYSKQKHDNNLNYQLIIDALKHGFPEVVSYYENPWIKKTRQAYSGQWKDALSLKNLSIKKMLVDQTGLSWNFTKHFNYHNHHLSHAAAGFQTSPFNDATIVVIDAIGEWDTITIWNAQYNHNGYAKYEKVWGVKYPNSIGLFYSAMTDRVGLRPLDEEYILMGMAAYGMPIYSRDLINTFWETNNLDKTIFKLKENLHAGTHWRNNELMEEQDNYDIASSSQQVLEFMVGHIMSYAKKHCKSTNLVYMGGVALNCVANTKIANNWNNIWIMPNPGDAGSSLGAAALTYGRKLNWEHPYLGYNISGRYPEAEIIKELLEGNIVGVANGKAEFGPRALGNRSLLADPRGDDIKDKVNEIKRRQKFRPFAPMILEERAHEYFDMPDTLLFETATRADYANKHGVILHRNKRKLSSPYMQFVAKCKKPKEFPAIVHADGTSRVQTVGPNDNPNVRNLLKMWEYYTGCPMLLNTSLNIRGEPMVNDVADAMRFTKKYGIPVYTAAGEDLPWIGM